MTCVRAISCFVAAVGGLVACSSAAGQGMAILGGASVQPFEGVGFEGPRPVRGTVVGVDLAELRAALLGAPVERAGVTLASYGLSINLPDPDGDWVPCVVAASAVMEPGLAAQFPEMQTFIVQRLDGLATGRIELTQRGLTGMLRVSGDAGAPTELGRRGGAWMIDLWRTDDPSRAVSYWLADLPATGGDWVCSTQEGVHGVGAPADELPESGGSTYGERAVQSTRTVRAAMACTGEWAQHVCASMGHAPNVADALAGMVTVISRVNVVYEADLGVHFNLIANNNQLVFIDPATDPYGTSCDGTGGADCSGPLLESNTVVINGIVGSGAYDIGHVLTRIYGGVANLQSVCTVNKGGGVSGIPRGGDIDPLSALVVIHEMGHQFGAQHTFSGTRGRCGGNVSLGSAWEAGSGSSPMAYAGGCPVGDAPPSDNVAQFADPFFHSGSLAQMQSFLNLQSTKNCLPLVTSTNTVPVVTLQVPTSTAVPPGTPFVLSLSASDADGDVLTMSWEQADTGVARPLSGAGSVDNGQGSLFRIFPPVLSGSRTFPRMSDVLSGVPTPGEQLPTVTGVTRRFRAVVRDNHPGAGSAVTSPTVTVSIASGMTPFAVTGPAQGANVSRCGMTVTWNVGGTNLSPIGLSSVTVLLSLDDGATFPYVLGTFANSGSATIDPAVVPVVNASAARVRVDAAGKIFFAVSRPFTLNGCVADFDGSGGTPDSGDIDAFFGAWLAGDASADADCSGGTPDASDVDAFFVVWLAGGC